MTNQNESSANAERSGLVRATSSTVSFGNKRMGQGSIDEQKMGAGDD